MFEQLHELINSHRCEEGIGGGGDGESADVCSSSLRSSIESEDSIARDRGASSVSKERLRLEVQIVSASCWHFFQS